MRNPTRAQFSTAAGAKGCAPVTTGTCHVGTACQGEQNGSWAADRSTVQCQSEPRMTFHSVRSGAPQKLGTPACLAPPLALPQWMQDGAVTKVGRKTTELHAPPSHSCCLAAEMSAALYQGCRKGCAVLLSSSPQVTRCVHRRDCVQQRPCRFASCVQLCKPAWLPVPESLVLVSC